LGNEKKELTDKDLSIDHHLATNLTEMNLNEQPSQITLLTNNNTTNTMLNLGNDGSLPNLTKQKTAIDGSTGGLPIKE
jgi:hypothetical protein